MPRLKPGARARSSSASSRLKRPRLASSSSVPVPGDESAKKEKSLEEMIEDEDLEDPNERPDTRDWKRLQQIGNVPLEWYKDEDHDNPDAWRTIKDHKNQREVVLTETDLEVIRRIRERTELAGVDSTVRRMYPSLATDTTEMVEFENPEARIHPEGKAHPPKSRFLPSKWERMKVKRLVSLLRQGKIRQGADGSDGCQMFCEPNSKTCHMP
eukprot:g31037.t1